MRRGAVLSALLLTALLLYLWPGLLKGLWTDTDNRMAGELRPAQRRTLTLWWLPGEMGDQRCISRLCTRLEKETPGLRVFLRRADAAELTVPDALLPDAVLFGTGDVVNPEQLFLPLTLSEDDGNLSSGKSGGETYALPLWYEENVLSVPNGWLEEDGTPTVTVQPHSLLGQTAATPKPETDEDTVYPVAEAIGRKRAVGQPRHGRAAAGVHRAVFFAGGTGLGGASFGGKAGQGYGTGLDASGASGRRSKGSPDSLFTAACCQRPGTICGPLPGHGGDPRPACLSPLGGLPGGSGSRRAPARRTGRFPAQRLRPHPGGAERPLRGRPATGP